MLPSGTYFIGDPAFVIEDARWPQFCDLVDSAPNSEGEFVIDDKPFALYAPLWGDGTYFSSHGKNKPLGVTSSSIACVEISHIPEDQRAHLESKGLILQFADSFRTGSHPDGHIFFGHVSVHTG